MTRSRILRRLFMFTLIAVFVVVVARNSYEQGYRSAQRKFQDELDRVTLRELVGDAEEIRVRLGRAPNDQEELVSLMRRPMPKIHDDGIFIGVRVERAINYRRTGDNSFQLTYELMATDDWTYDSNKAEAGWVQSWY